jgi:hypothetical protein
MENVDNSYLKKKDYIILASFSGLSIFLSLLSFVPILSVVIQLLIFFGTIIFFKNRPIFFFIVNQFFLINLQNILATKTDRDLSNINSEGYYLNFNIVILLFLFYIILEIFNKKVRIKINIPILLLCFLIFFSMNWIQSDLYYNNEFVFLLLLYLGAHNFIKSDYDVRLLLFSTIINGGIFGIIAIPFIINFSEDFIYDMLLDTNYASLYCVVIVASSYICLLVYNDMLNFKLRIFIFSIIFLLGFVIVLTMSRTGLVVYLLTFIYYLYKESGNKKNILIYIGLICLISIFFIDFNKYSFYFDNAVDRFYLDDVNSMNGRTDIAELYLNQFSQSNFFIHIFGNGYYSTFVPHIAPHNSFIAILSFFGILGSLFFIWYFVDLFKIIQKTKYRPFELLQIVFIIFGITLETFKFQMLVLMLPILFAVRKLKAYSKIS